MNHRLPPPPRPSPRPARPSGGDGIEITSLSAIEHVLSHRPDKIRVLFVQTTAASKNARIASLCETAREHGISVDSSPHHSRDHEPIRAMVAPFTYTPFEAFRESLEPKKRSVVLALDHLQDPQNFGALARTAEGFAVDGILIPKDRGVTVGPGVYHASVGAVETIPIVMVANLGEALRKLKDSGFWIVGSSLGKNAKPPSEAPDFEKVALVLGAELEGISPVIENACDWQVEIPLQGKVQSLNVSVAGALLMYLFTQREGAASPQKPE